MFKIAFRRLNPFSHIHIKRRDLVGIDMSGDNLKVARLRISNNKKELVNVFSNDIGGLHDEELSKVVKSSFGELNAKNAEVISIIPSHSVITKNIEIPSTNPQEIRDIINLQASRFTPYSREEIIVDYVDIDTYKHSYTKILLVIVTRDVVKRQLEILKSAGVKLEKVALGTESLSHFIPKALKINTESVPLGLVHIDQDFSDFIIISKNKPVFVRNIPIGTHHLLEEREAYESRFVDEIAKSIDSYQSEDVKKKPERLFLTGAVEKLKHLENILNDSLHLSTATTPPFNQLISAKKSLKIPSFTWRVSFFNVVASLFSHDEAKINLIPEEIKLRKSLEQRGRDLIKTGIFVFSIFILVFSLFVSKIYFKNEYLKTLTEKYQTSNKEADKLDDDFAKVGIIRSYLSNRGYSLDVLTELYEIAPLDLELNDIRFDDTAAKLSVKGTASSMSTVFSFVDSMEKSPYFRDVKTRYTTKRKEGTEDVTDFEVNCILDKEDI